MNTRKAFLMVAATAGCGIGCLLAADQPLPWEREISLREAAKSVALTEKLNPTSPLPSGEYFGGAAMSINNLKMRTTLWGPPDDRAIAAATGSAVTATFTPGADGQLEAFVTVVTTMDGPDIIGIARKRLENAAARGFDGAVEANTKWWSAFYDRRENGRGFHGVSGTACSDDVRAIYLRNECYPMMKQMALFYAAYAKKGEDGNYHVIPSMEEERWGFYPQLARNKDVISSLCLFRWALTRAAEAAELLGVDADLRQHWRDVAAPSLSPPAKKRTVFILWKLLHAAACPAGS